MIMNVNKNLGEKIIKDMLPIKVCMLYELSETFSFLVCVIYISASRQILTFMEGVHWIIYGSIWSDVYNEHPV